MFFQKCIATQEFFSIYNNSVYNFCKEQKAKVHPKEMGLKKFAKTLLKRAERHFKVLEPLVGDDETLLEFEKNIGKMY